MSEYRTADAILDPGPAFVDVVCDGGRVNMGPRLELEQPANVGIVEAFERGVVVVEISGWKSKQGFHVKFHHTDPSESLLPHIRSS